MKAENKRIVEMAIKTVSEMDSSLLEKVAFAGKKKNDLYEKLTRHQYETIEMLKNLADNPRYNEVQQGRLDEYERIQSGYEIAKEVYSHFEYLHRKKSKKVGEFIR